MPSAKTPDTLCRDHPLRGVALMIVGNFCFAVMSAFGKVLGQNYPVHEVVFARSLGALIPILIVVLMTKGLLKGLSGLRTQRFKGHLFRSITGMLSMVLLFASLGYLSLASAYAFTSAGPIFVVLFSIFLLKEHVGWRHWAAVLVGFTGVLVMLHPGGGEISMTGVLMALGSAVFYAFAMIGVRKLASTEESSTTTFWFMLLTTLILLPFVVAQHKTPENMTDFLTFLGMGLVGGVGQLAMTGAYKYAPASILSPLTYTVLLWACLFSVIFWDEQLGLSLILGGGLVVASGIYLARHEIRRTKREKR